MMTEPVTTAAAPPRDARAATSGFRAAQEHLLALAVYLLATVVFTWPLALNLTTAIPGDGFDGWQNYWNQWWIKQALVDRLANPLYTDAIYHPTGVTLYFQTLNPFNGITTLPVQIAFGLIAAYNAVVFLSWVLAGYGMFLLARWVMGTAAIGPRLPIGDTRAGYVAAIVAGLVYTLAPFHMAHLLGHMQVMSLQWLPFYVLALLHALHAARNGRPWLRRALWAALFLIFTGLCDWYFVLYLFLFTGVTILWMWLAAPGRPTLRGLVRIVAPAAVAGGVFAVALSFWLVPMVVEALHFRFMVRPSADLYILSASVMDFLVPNRLHTLFRPESFTWIGNQIAPVSERTISIGYVVLGLAIAAFVLARRKASFWWVMAIFFFVLALGPQWHFGNITMDDIPAAALQGQEMTSWTPYGLLNKLVPFMRVSRSVSRFALMVQFSMAVLAGMGFWLLIERLRRRSAAETEIGSIEEQTTKTQSTPSGTKNPPAASSADTLRAPSRSQRRRSGSVLAGAALIGLLLFEYWVAPYPLSPPDTPAYYATLAADPDPRAVLNLPMNYDRPGYLLYQTVHGKPLTVAYISRDDPRTLTERVPVLQHFRHLGPDIIDDAPEQVAATVFADLDVGTVILDRYKMPGGDERTYTEALAAAIFAGQEPLYADERITVYKVGDSGEPQPYLALGPVNWGPLTTPENAPAFRTLLDGGAEVAIHHAPERGQVRLRYGYDAPASVRIHLAGDDASLATGTAQAGEVVVDLTAALERAREAGLATEPLRLDVRADRPVQVERISLDADAP
ncbi:MAG: hypothetical protein KIT77_25075 [Caldilinea sp.]|nr:hypothetical protein [Caldilinea sp.]